MKKTLADLAEIREKTKKNLYPDGINGISCRIVVGMGTCGISAGAAPVFEALADEVNRRGLTDVKVVKTGCIGMCRLEPMLDVYMDGEKVTYVNMNADKARQVIVEHIVNKNIIEDYTIGATEK